MSGISTGVGLFSGINTGDLIEQLLSIDARPKALAQRRIAQLQQSSAGYLDLNSKMAALKAAAETFRVDKTFQTKGVSSSNKDALSATASVDAAAGTYTFLVDRLVSTQQMLSRGFANRETAGVGLTSLSVETHRARLDRDVALADLNNASGVTRGKIVVTDSGNRSTTVDLSRAVTVGDVLDAINNNGVAQVTASVADGRLVLKDNANGSLTVANSTGSTAATSLGIAGSASGTLTGQLVYALNANTSLGALNDGNGVRIGNTVAVGNAAVWDFKITLSNGVDTKDVLVNLGDVYQDVNGTTTKVEGAVTSMSGVLTRINQAIQTASTGTPWVGTVSASINTATGGLEIVDSGNALLISTGEQTGQDTARDLGLSTTSAVTGRLTGKRILAGLNSTLTSTLNGGQGVTGDGRLQITSRNGTSHLVNLNLGGSVTDLLNAITTQTGGSVRASLDARGTSIVLTDTTGSTSSNLIVEGTTGSDTAASLGISTGATGVAAATHTGAKLQHAYLSSSSSLATLPDGSSLGTGKFRITDSLGATGEVTVNNGVETFGELIREINTLNLKAKARLNARGDGIEIYEDNSASPAGTVKIKVEDVEGVVAQRLNLKGEAKGTGVQNTLDGTFERVIAFSAADSLNTIVSKVNAAKYGVQAAAISDGTGATPFRLSLISAATGRDGRVLIDTGAFDLGLSTLDAGEDARLFFGSSDPARGVAVTSSSNRFDSVIAGLKIDAKSADEDPVTLTVTNDTDAVEAKVTEFIEAFNAITDRVDQLTKYDAESKKGGALLGDGTAFELKSALIRTVLGPTTNATGAFRRLADVGITVGKSGDLKLDSEKFRAALQQDPASVESLFTTKTAVDDAELPVEGVPEATVRNPNPGTTFSELGIMAKLEVLIDRYTNSQTGVLTIKSKGMDNQIKAQNDRITFLDDKLERRREFLQRKFTAMEQTLGRLNAQSSSLGSLSGGAAAARR